MRAQRRNGERAVNGAREGRKARKHARARRYSAAARLRHPQGSSWAKKRIVLRCVAGRTCSASSVARALHPPPPPPTRAEGEASSPRGDEAA